MPDRTCGASDGFPNLRAKRILVVEDDPVIAVDYHFQLQSIGAQAAAYEPTVQAALDYTKARGYRSTRTLKAITYLIAGKLDLRLPT